MNDIPIFLFFISVKIIGDIMERKHLVSEDKVETTINELQYNPKMIVEARAQPDDIKGFNPQKIVEVRNEISKEDYNAQQMIQIVNEIPRQDVKISSSENSDDKNDG